MLMVQNCDVAHSIKLRVVQNCNVARERVNVKSRLLNAIYRIWENPAYSVACAMIYMAVFITYGITLRMSYFYSYNLSSMLYYVYNHGNALTSSQQTDIFKRSNRPERAAASARSPLLRRVN